MLATAESPTVKRVKVTSVYDTLCQALKPIIVLVGGSGSSKSYSMAQFFIWKLVNEQNKVLGIGRKTLPSLRMTAMLLVVDLLKAYGIYQLCDHSKTENFIDYKTNRIQFYGLDDPEKIKSFNANYIWLEEANEFTFEDFTIQNIRLNRDPGNERNQLYLSFNPVDSWIFDKLENNPDCQWIESTYKDNPFYPASSARILEGLKEQDLNYYNIYALGKRGKLENTIYPNFNLIDNMPSELEMEDYGLDFGYENPSVCVHVGIAGDNLYMDEVLYQTHLTNSELIDRLKQLPRLDIYPDSAEPQRIEEICRAGLNCYPAMKDVQLGIDTVKRYKMHITKSSVHLIKEVRGYHRKKDKDGRILEEPVKFDDHGIDAARYGVVGLVGLKPLVPVEQIVIYDTMQLVRGV